MNCFYYLKDKARSRSRRSAPELRSSGSNSGGSQAIARSLGSGVLRRGINELYQEKSPSLRVFSYSELRQATRDFNRTHKIGEGGFGCVYKAHLVIPLQSDPLLVAIKKLNKESFQGHKQWLAEVQFLGVVEHPNLVKLIGYCAEDDDDSGIQRLLVYEYMTNRSLEDHLFKKRCAVLPWEMRLQIILGAAQGLAYLHEGLELQVIFRDFKTSNVLLDEHFQAKLSDFGLAREGPSPGRSHVSTAVIGTHGYAAPEYVETGHLTSKSDVWSFGVVLYEILTGRRSLERSRPRSEEELLEWVKQYSPDSKKFSFIMDPRLEKQYSLSAARKIAKLAETCIAKNPKDRPKMTHVVEQLKNIINDTPNDWSSESSTCDQSVESDHNQGNQNRTPESARRRQAQLEKLGDHVQGFSRRKFLIIQKAQPREQQISRKQYLLKGKS